MILSKLLKGHNNSASGLRLKLKIGGKVKKDGSIYGNYNDASYGYERPGVRSFKQFVEHVERGANSYSFAHNANDQLFSRIFIVNYGQIDGQIGGENDYGHTFLGYDAVKKQGFANYSACCRGGDAYSADGAKMTDFKTAYKLIISGLDESANDWYSGCFCEKCEAIRKSAKKR